MNKPLLSIRCGFLLLLLIGLLLSGCTVGKFDVDYPRTWAQRLTTEEQTCPNISGTYVNKGERRITNGGDCYNECGSLISELTTGSDLISIFKITTHLTSESPDHTIEIQQFANQEISITEWWGNGQERSRISTFQLTQEKGDYQCETGELILKTRVHTMILIIGNAIGTESRVFSKATDGSLVMKRFTKVGGHVLVFPEAYGVGEWVRWNKVEAIESDEQLFR